MNILVCDDDREIVEAIRIYLEEGYTVLGLRRPGGPADNRIPAGAPDHFGHRDARMDGLRATVRLRVGQYPGHYALSQAKIPIRSWLNMVDDYITSLQSARTDAVKSQLRRYVTLGSLETRDSVYQTGGLVIDDESKQVTVDGEEVRLTPVQYKILRLLTANAGRVFSIDEIYAKVWQEEAYGADNTVAVHIRRYVEDRDKLKSRNT